MKAQTSLVATLGGQPQVVTFALDLLLARGEKITQVIVVYLASSPRYYQAYRKLTGEFAGDRYNGQTLHLRSIPIRRGETTLAEARAPEEVEAVRQTFFQIFATLKGEGHRIHLGLTGGRRIMALLALSTAARHFTTEDRAWHLHTPSHIAERAHEGALMHLPQDAGVHLIEVPLVPWAAYLPGLAPLLGNSLANVRAQGWLGKDERARCQQVWVMLTRRQQDVLRILASGYTRQQAAEQLNIGITTVDSHKTEVFRECRRAWAEVAVKIDLQFLRERFRPFLLEIGVV